MLVTNQLHVQHCAVKQQSVKQIVAYITQHQAMMYHDTEHSSKCTQCILISGCQAAVHVTHSYHCLLGLALNCFIYLYPH